jgi:hypothetical protein
VKPFHPLTPLMNSLSRSIFSGNPVVGGLAFSCITGPLSWNSFMASKIVP